MDQSPAYRNGAMWFFWLAGLSMLNSILGAFGASIRLIFGLGFTQVTDGFLAAAFEEGSAGMGVAFSLATTAIVAAVFAGIGFLALRGARLAYIGGLVLYIVDTLVLLGVTVMLSAWGVFGLDLLFHGFVLFQLIVGLTTRPA
jgi:hypothetical protein